MFVNNNYYIFNCQNLIISSSLFDTSKNQFFSHSKEKVKFLPPISCKKLTFHRISHYIIIAIIIIIIIIINR